MSFKNLAIKDTYITEKNDIPSLFENYLVELAIVKLG